MKNNKCDCKYYLTIITMLAVLLFVVGSLYHYSAKELRQHSHCISY